MNLIENLKTAYDIVKETKKQITLTKRRVIDEYNYAKQHRNEFDKLCHKKLKRLNKLPSQKLNLTKKKIFKINYITSNVK